MMRPISGMLSPVRDNRVAAAPRRLVVVQHPRDDVLDLLMSRKDPRADFGAS